MTGYWRFFNGEWHFCQSIGTLNMISLCQKKKSHQLFEERSKNIPAGMVCHKCFEEWEKQHDL